MDKFLSSIYDELVDMSKLNISSHALMQYNLKCFPTLSILQVAEQMRERLKRLKKVEPLKAKKKYANSEYYIDEDEIIYVVTNNTVVTTYPNERIFQAKPFFSNKKTGFKWL